MPRGWGTAPRKAERVGISGRAECLHPCGNGPHCFPGFWEARGVEDVPSPESNTEAPNQVPSARAGIPEAWRLFSPPKDRAAARRRRASPGVNPGADPEVTASRETSAGEAARAATRTPGNRSKPEASLESSLEASPEALGLRTQVTVPVTATQRPGN